MRVALCATFTAFMLCVNALRESEHDVSLQEALGSRADVRAQGPVNLDGTVAKKGWECGKPEEDVANRELVKDPKTKGRYLVYNWLKKDACQGAAADKWRVMRDGVDREERKSQCKSSITGAWDDHGCMTVEWRIDNNKCWMRGRNSDGTFNNEVVKKRSEGAVTVTCNDIMNASVLAKYSVDRFDDSNMFWFHV
mmetsp:Transcript_37802/g.70538  ORF Transcript_37802/g.70538 Transcript_37802/m.70538 type:complete len:195 (+) Transcript_37802:67-651(+)